MNITQEQVEGSPCELFLDFTRSDWQQGLFRQMEPGLLTWVYTHDSAIGFAIHTHTTLGYSLYFTLYNSHQLVLRQGWLMGTCSDIVLAMTKK